MAIDYSKKKVLVTGGGGFIGARLVHALLEKGTKVKVLDVRAGLLKEETNQNLEFIGIGSDELSGGIADKDLVEQAVEDVDVIYHWQLIGMHLLGDICFLWQIYSTLTLEARLTS